MKKSSLGRKSSNAASSRKTSDFIDKKSSIPLLSKSSSCSVLGVPPSTSRKRELSADRISINRPRDGAFDKMGEYNTPCRPDTLRTPRQLTMSSGRPSSISSKKGDTRPLTDKGWQSSALNTVLTTLNLDNDGYNIIQTHKTLKPMSLATFVDVCQYLLGRLDSKIQLTRMNYLTELLFFMKKLMYKGKIDKMMLQTELVLAVEDFKAQGFDSIYPQSIEPDTADSEELNLKYVVPLFLDLWSYVGKQEVFDINNLLENNRDLVNHAIEKSGFSNDVFDQMAEVKKLYEDANKKNKEALEAFHKLEVQNKTINEKVNKGCEKNNQIQKEIDELQEKYQEELNNIAELENEIKYNEDERLVVQNIVDQYAHSDQDMTPDEYKNYIASKKTLLEDIKFEETSIFNLEEILLDETIATSKLENKCEDLFREYNSNIYESMKVDVSLQKALCLSRPRLGVTPCNEFTANFLEKIVKSIEECITGMEEKLKQTSDDSTENFKQSEDMKEKMALLNKLKSDKSDILSDHEKLKIDLEKRIVTLSSEHIRTDKENESTEALLKKNLQDYSAKEIIIKQTEEKLRLLFTINQKKLNCRHRSILVLSKKFESNLNTIKDEFLSFYNKMENHKKSQK